MKIKYLGYKFLLLMMFYGSEFGFTIQINNKHAVRFGLAKYGSFIQYYQLDDRNPGTYSKPKIIWHSNGIAFPKF